MTAEEFAKVLQDELILSRDPHIVQRFVELLNQHFEPITLLEPVTTAPSATEPNAVVE